MKLEIGNEKRFFDFIGSLNDKDKIALISHTDLDGITAAYVVNKVVGADIVKFVNYEDLNSALIQYLKEKKITKIIFTDLYIGNRDFLMALEKFAEILILDHHLANTDWNSSRTVFIKGEDGYCAGYLCYWLFSKVQDVKKLDWLVACACIADYCHVKPAEWLASVFEEHGDRLENIGMYVRKSGKIWELQYDISLALIYLKNNLNEVFNKIGENFGDIGNLKVYADKVRGEIDRLVSLFEKEKQAFPDGYLFEFNPKFWCGSIVSSIISNNQIHKTILTLRLDDEHGIYHVSARRQDRKVSMNDFLKKLLEEFEGADAGGHVPAAGGQFLKKYIEEFKKRLGLKA